MTEWIRVKDKLPENNELVLAFVRYDPGDGTWDYRKEYKILLFSFGNKKTEYRDDMPGYTLSKWDETAPNWMLSDCYRVVAWMPLPQPPEEI